MISFYACDINAIIQSCFVIVEKNPNKNIVLENQQKCLCHTKWPIVQKNVNRPVI